MNSFPDFSLLESCQLYIIAKYRASNCCKIEAVIQRCSVKVFLKILQNSEENPCARVSFLIKLQLKKRLWHRYFPVNIAKNWQNVSSSYFLLHLISWAPSTLRHNSCKTRYPQKDICGGVHSYCNSNFKTFKLK